MITDIVIADDKIPYHYVGWLHTHLYLIIVSIRIPNDERKRCKYSDLQLTGFIGDFPTSPLVKTGDIPLAWGNGGGGGGGGGMLFDGGDCDMTGGGGGKSTGGVADAEISTGGGGGGGNVSRPLLMLLPRVGVLADGVLENKIKIVKTLFDWINMFGRFSNLT